MTEAKDPGQEALEELEVVELESEEGEQEEFVILERVEIQGKNYAIMATLEDVENMEQMSEEEFRDVYGEEGFFHLMREEGEEFYSITKEEYEKIREDLDKKLASMGE